MGLRRTRQTPAGAITAWTRPPRLAWIALILSLLGACSDVHPTPSSTLATSPTSRAATGTALPLDRATPSPSASPLPTNTLAPTATLGPNDWQSLPVIPAVSRTARQIYQRGLALGNNPNAFSKIGDCESTPTWFLGDFDRNPPPYRLGEYTDLETVILHFAGSFGRTSLAAGRGFNASSVLTALWADPAQCQPGESPLACEIRVHRPSIAFVMLGTNDRWHQDRFEGQMRLILNTLIEQGVVPILATKADNLEGDGSLNLTIARLALEYDLPLWNFWLALQPLPDHGLQPDGAHITWGHNLFDDPLEMERGWPIRNLTALQSLAAVWRTLAGAEG